MNSSTVILIWLCAVIFAASASGQNAYKKGDTFTANVFQGGCVKVTVIGVDPPYYVRIEEGTYKGSETYYNINRMAECKQGGANQPKDDGPAGIAQNGNGAKLGVGSRVDVYYSANRPRGRGRVIQVSNTQYKVSYDGCGSTFDSWEDHDRVRSEARIGNDDPDVRYTIGRWSTVVAGISSTAIAWGKGGGVEIKADGTFTWFQDKGQAPVRGRWTTYSKLAGADKFSIDFEDGIQITDAKGEPWKVFRAKGPKGEDTVTINRLCFGAVRQTGYRAR